MEKLRVLVFHHADVEPYVTLLNRMAPELELLVCKTEHDIEKWISEADILFVSTRFPAHLLAKGTSVKWIQVMGAGVERFVQEKLPEGAVLTRVNVGFGDKIAEYVMAYMLLFTQRITEVIDNQRQKQWVPLDLMWLKGEVLGVAGVGAIGTEVARRGRCFGMKVVGFDVNPKNLPELDQCYGWSEFLEFVAIPKYLVICLPLTPKTQGLFGREAFEAMRRDSIIVNVARGPIIRQSELVEALRARKIAGAVLDVFEQEPLPTHNPLWEMPNVIVTPHHAGPSLPQEMVEFFLANLARFRRGEPLRGRVDLTQGF